ncbi:MAG: DUF4386 domain-containing protein [Caldilineaceae bacterium]
MPNHRKSAVIVGVLFIIATAFLFIGEAVYKPILSSPDYLEITYPNRATVTIGVLLEFVIVLAMPLIPVFAFPVLRRHNEALAIGYIVFRALESVVIIAVAEINKLSLIGVSKAYLQGGADAGYFEAIGTSIQAATYWGDAGGLLYVLLFGVGGLLFYTLLYQSRLIPRWLSAWGWIAIVMILIGALLGPFMEFTLAMTLVVVLPIAVQEMVMALWLIVKGWNPEAVEQSATDSKSERIDMSGTMRPTPA